MRGRDCLDTQQSLLMRVGNFVAFTTVMLANLGCALEREWDKFVDVSMAAADTTTDTDDGGATTGGASSGVGEDATDASTAETTETETTGPETTGPSLENCGDGVLDPGEECDSDFAYCNACHLDRVVFVTSHSGHGDFAKAGDVDALCNEAAAEAGLLLDGKPRFRAWVSTHEAHAADRIYRSPGRYMLRNGLIFALSWQRLVEGWIHNPLNVDEHGNVTAKSVWTNTGPDGRRAQDGADCNQWSSGESFHKGLMGRTDRLDSTWTLETADGAIQCNVGGGLYCFESITFSDTGIVPSQPPQNLQ